MDPPLDVDKKRQLEGHPKCPLARHGPKRGGSPTVVRTGLPLSRPLREATADRKVRELLEEIAALKDQAARYNKLEIQAEAIKLQLARTVRFYEEILKQLRPGR